MRDILPEIEDWRRDGKQVAVATIVSTWGSAPRPVGSKMAISDACDMAGSVSGGCVEGAVFEEAQGVIAGNRPRLVEYGVSDQEAWAVGLSCGGRIEVFIELLEMRSEIYGELKCCLDADRLVALATVIDGPGRGRQLLIAPAADDTPAIHGDLGASGLERAVAERAGEQLVSFRSGRQSFATADVPAEVFIEVHPPRPKLIVVGAVHVASALVRFANTLGFRTIVVDPRTAFATPERFAHADQLRTDWPDEALRDLGIDKNTFVALLSHDLKLDLPALEVALPSRARYIGALGSKKTHGKRLAALAEKGFSEPATRRIHNPIGLDLGGRRAEEIAVAIIAEMIAVSYGKSP